MQEERERDERRILIVQVPTEALNKSVPRMLFVEARQHFNGVVTENENALPPVRQNSASTAKDLVVPVVAAPTTTAVASTAIAAAETTTTTTTTVVAVLALLVAVSALLA
jgi:hypothetical protein